MTPDTLVAAGPWLTGSPDPGEYIVEYEDSGELHYAVWQYFDGSGWHKPTGNEDVVRYAPIHSPEK